MLLAKKRSRVDATLRIHGAVCARALSPLRLSGFPAERMCDGKMSELSVAESSIWTRVSISYAVKGARRWGGVGGGEFKRSAECVRGTGPTTWLSQNASLIL